MAFVKTTLVKKPWHLFVAFFISYAMAKHDFYEIIFIF
jgi:hypothetical protein